MQALSMRRLPRVYFIAPDGAAYSSPACEADAVQLGLAHEGLGARVMARRSDTIA